MQATNTRKPVTETSRAYRQELVSRPLTAEAPPASEAETPPASEAETLTADEMDALIEDAPDVNPGAFVPTDAAGVEWVLGKIADARARAARIRENADRMARAEERQAEALEWRYGGALQHFLRGQIEGGKRKSIRLFNGALGYRTKPAGVCVTDPAAALAWAQENLPAAVTLHLDKKALSDRLTATGEALPFAALQPSEEVFYIRQG